MFRLSAIAFVLLACAFIVHTPSDGAPQQQKNQMVKGTIKDVQLDKDVLIILQAVKKDKVDRELSIEQNTEFTVTQNGVTKTGTGSAGLKLLENAKGAMVQVKCDKDVKVLSVKATIK